MIKLNTNENPYPPAPGVAKVLKEMDADSLRLYPDPAADILVERTVQVLSCRGRSRFFVGVGSDDVLFDVLSDLFLTRTNRFCFRILLILFIKYGRSYTESRIAARSWMSSFVW